jgi:type I restriction enzyme, S subunit
MTEIKNVPVVRFKGFSDEWVGCELGGLIEITSASRVHKNEWTESGVPFFRSSDVVANYKGIVNEKAFISYELYKELSDKSGCVQTNDLLVTGGGSIGIPYLIKTNEPLYFKDADLLWLKNGEKLNGYFLYTFFSTLSFRRYVNSITHIGTISHYTVVQAKSTPIDIPDKDEQDEIGEFLLSLDKLISLHQAKVNKLTKLKKAMLEKMFPKQGADVPEIRFKGFEGAWEEKALCEVFDDLKGTGLSKEKIGVHGKNKCILYGHLFTKFSEVINEIDSRTDFDEGILSKENDILMPSSTTTTGIDLAKASSLKESGVLLGGDIIILRIKEKGSSDFFAYYLTHGVNKKIAEVTQGTTIIHLYFSGLKDVLLKVPCPAEQALIGVYFQNLDKTITLHQTELEKFNNLKKACLEKMFV